MSLSQKYHGGDKTIRHRGTGAEALNGPNDEHSSQPRQSPANTWTTAPPSGPKIERTQRKYPGPRQDPDTLLHN